ncbi:SDR family NAD(P)-dependent oxidoreductase [Dictyoglomus thermophilum]|uniref:3-oxoacyl-[acyl-carrier protein] reductase n=2 Tax=Dictyoglomus thermophilum TaxID=14 RepID=B5YCK0_DICT6|nr:SDR family NAD(P)-dependent oxidoreductase [Dictyoglomus thermophilum]ACI18363.1 3-oxoacyl-[acyl-carrier protein] reductase [Dictyoglomus thermophilum H-6-12]TYT23406.1 SDR family NAD(P)-dependent oxidoreductase [Dictyoglomus thermophilum]
MAGILEGRRMVITGASRGIGFEICKLFLKEGASIIGVAKDEKRLKEAEKLLREMGDFEGVAVDLEEDNFTSKIVEKVEKKWNALDVLFNNAGVMLAYGGFLEESDEVFERTFKVNLYAPYKLVKAMLPFLLRGKEPRIINTSSGAGIFDEIRKKYDIASYRLSKFALNGFTIILANELKGKIAVNAFDPGWVKTDLGGPNAPGSPEDSARGALAVVTLPFEVTGKFFKDGREINF